MQITKVGNDYELSEEGGRYNLLQRDYNGAESWACLAIDQLLAEIEALKSRLGEVVQPW